MAALPTRREEAYASLLSEIAGDLYTLVALLTAAVSAQEEEIPPMLVGAIALVERMGYLADAAVVAGGAGAPVMLDDIAGWIVSPAAESALADLAGKAGAA